MRIILDPYLSIRAAGAALDLPQSALRRGCRNGTIPHIQRDNRIYIYMVALMDRMDADDGGKALVASGRSASPDNP